MLGDMDLLHIAREHALTAPHGSCAPAAECPVGDSRFSRVSLDSGYFLARTSSNASSNAGGSLSSSWGGLPASPRGPSALTRRLSLPSPFSTSSPVDIPARGAGADPLMRRNTAFAGFGTAAGATPSAAGAAPDAPLRLPALVRSLSKGLSESLDFR